MIISTAISKIAAIEAACFDEPWSESAIEAALQSDYTIYSLVEQNNETVGFVLGSCVLGECELHRIAVLPERRGNGFASILMQEFEEKSLSKGAVSVFLEVRSRNAAAIALYQKHNYEKIALRKNYYASDDAIVMQKILRKK